MIKSLGDHAFSMASNANLLNDAKFISRYFSQSCYSYTLGKVIKLVRVWLNMLLMSQTFLVWMENVSLQLFSIMQADIVNLP